MGENVQGEAERSGTTLAIPDLPGPKSRGFESVAATRTPPVDGEPRCHLSDSGRAEGPAPAGPSVLARGVLYASRAYGE